MKKLITIVLLALIITSCTKETKGYWIENVNIINVEDGSILNNHNIKIVNDTIAQIKNGKLQSKLNVIDGNNGFVIPGLWDMHIHLDMVDNSSIPLFVVNGITGVRDMGGDINFIKNLKQQNDNLVPDLKAAGTIIESPQFLDAITLFLGRDILKSRVAYNIKDNPQALIDSIINQGSDFIKIRNSESEEAFKALAKAANNRNVKFTGHIASNQDIFEVVKSGLSSIEHSDFFSILKLDSLSRKQLAIDLSELNTYYTPTLITTQKSRLTPKENLLDVIKDTLNITYPNRKYLSPKLIESWMMEYEMSILEGPLDWNTMTQSFFLFGKELALNDIPLLAGTDVGVGLIIPGSSLHDELELMVSTFNVSNLEALQSATINATRHLGIKNQGTIKVGNKANLVILESNPLEKISNTRNISVVIKNGLSYNKEARDIILNSIEKNISVEHKSYTFDRLKNLKENIKMVLTKQQQQLKVE